MPARCRENYGRPAMHFLENIPRLSEEAPTTHNINILEIVAAAAGFHPRHDALDRCYLYQISPRRRAFAKPFIWWVKDRLYVEKMRIAAAFLPGRHDFAPFFVKR